jgi:hypothetical protein
MDLTQPIAIVDLVATPIEPGNPQASPLPAPTIAVAVEEADAALPEPVYARAAEPVADVALRLSAV